jgi:hypothetical protein
MNFAKNVTTVNAMAMLLAILCLAKSAMHDLPKFSHFSDGRIHHFECFNIVRSIERETKEGKTEAEITSRLSAHCDHLEDMRKNICLSLIPSQIPRIAALIAEKKTPDVICEDLGFARNFGSGRLIRTDQCTKFVDLIRQDYAKRPKEGKADGVDENDPKHSNRKRIALEKPHTERGEDFRRAALDRLDRPFPEREPFRNRQGYSRASRGYGPTSTFCKDLDHEERIVCHILSRLVLRGMEDDLEAGTEATEICKKLEEKHLIKLTESAP